MPASPEESPPGGALLESQCKNACPCQPYEAPPQGLADFDTNAELAIDEVEAYSEDASLSSPIGTVPYPPIKEACSPRQASTAPVASHCKTLFSPGEGFPGPTSPQSPVVAARAVVLPQTAVLPAPFPARHLATAGAVALTAGQTAAVSVSSSSRAHQGGAPGVSTDSDGAIVSILLQADPAAPPTGRPVATYPGLVAGESMMTQAHTDHVTMEACSGRSAVRRFHSRSSGSRSVGATPPRSPTSLVTVGWIRTPTPMPDHSLVYATHPSLLGTALAMCGCYSLYHCTNISLLLSYLLVILEDSTRWIHRT